MSKERFYLQPFHRLAEPVFSICVDYECFTNAITLEYSVVGPIASLKIPPPNPSASRKDGLWEQTCFEFFVSERGIKKYWEFNFSPSLDWQAYSFEEYRAGRKDAEGITVDLERYESQTHFELKVKVGGLDIFEKPKKLEGAMTSVLEDSANQKTYWATEHRAKTPDFHQRSSFVSLNPRLLFF